MGPCIADAKSLTLMLVSRSTSSAIALEARRHKMKKTANVGDKCQYQQAPSQNTANNNVYRYAILSSKVEPGVLKLLCRCNASVAHAVAFLRHTAAPRQSIPKISFKTTENTKVFSATAELAQRNESTTGPTGCTAAEALLSLALFPLLLQAFVRLFFLEALGVVRGLTLMSQ